jgi:hypothetical protein
MLDFERGNLGTVVSILDSTSGGQVQIPPSLRLPTSLALRRTSRRTPANCLQGQASPPDGVAGKLRRTSVECRSEKTEDRRRRAEGAGRGNPNI